MGLVEYLLILVLTVAMVMALSKGVGKPLQTYIKNNVIDIVGCMLRVGQFPAQSYGICQAAVKMKFDFAGSVPDTSSGDGSSSSASQNDTASDENDKNESEGNSGGSDSNTSPKTKFRSSSSTGSINENDSNGFGETSDTQTVKIDSDELGKSSKNSAFQLESSDGQVVIIRKIKRNDRIGGSFFMTEDEVNEEAVIAAQTATKTQPVPVSLLRERTAENSFSVPKSKKRGPQGKTMDTSMEFSFFSIVKWGIIIAIFVVFGLFTLSQLNSIRKGWTE